jgi:hypothetical protein
MNSVVLTDSGEVWTWGEPWGEFALELQRAPRKVSRQQSRAGHVCGPHAFHHPLFSSHSDQVTDRQGVKKMSIKQMGGALAGTRAVLGPESTGRFDHPVTQACTPGPGIISQAHSIFC